MKLLVETYITSLLMLATATSNALRQYTYHSYGLQDMYWNDDVLFTDNLLSKIYCLVTCSRTLDCWTFTYDTQTQKCQGYSSRKKQSDSDVVTASNQIFVFQGLLFNSNSFKALFYCL